MFEGSIEYSAEMKGQQFDQIELRPPPGNQNITKIEVKHESFDKIIIIFNVIDVESWEQVDSMTLNLVNNLLDSISFYFGVCIGNPTVRGGTLSSKIISENGSVSANILPRGVTATGTITSASVVTYKNEDKEKIKKLLESEFSLEKHPYRSSFRHALQNTDPVVKYMSLYKILLEIFNDSQEQVDDFIRKIDPNVVQTQRPNNPRIIETVYTRLRNEMSHTRPKADILNTKNEINQNVSGFANIVKKAIQPLNK